MALKKYKLGQLIKKSELRNNAGEFSSGDVKGISIDKCFSETKADADNIDLNTFKIVKPYFFAFNTATSRNGEKISIAFNSSDKTLIVSSLYDVFCLSKFGKKVLDEWYLYLFFNRKEFDRYARIDSWGSAREYFRFSNMCDVDIELPSLETQRKFVKVYLSLRENLKSYEKGLDDLKLVCDSYIENLRKEFKCEKIGPYIEEKNEKNENDKIKLFQGINVDHVFTDPKRIAEDSENGSVVRNGQFAFNKVMKAHNTKLPIALREGPDCVVSNSYTVFEVVNQEKLLSKYLLLWLNRAETQRYAGFISFGTTRDIFTFDDMCEISIPMPSKKMQKSIVEVFEVYQLRTEVCEKLKKLLKDICPILIKGSIQSEKAA